MTDSSAPATADHPPLADDIPEQVRIRREKRERLLSAGIEPYPVGVDRTTSLADLRARFSDLDPDVSTGERAGVTGRVIFLRNSGKLCFVTIREGGAGDTGSELQVMVSLASVGAESLGGFQGPDVDLGDHLFAAGEVITSRRGELSVLADTWQIAAKALAAASRGAQGIVRGEPGPTALCRPDRPPAGTAQRRDPSAGQSLPAGDPGGPGLSRGRDANAAVAARGSSGPSVLDTHERHGHGFVPAHRPRAVSQALRGRRNRPGLRDQPELSQRGCRLHPLARIRNAGDLPGLQRLQRHGRADPDTRPECGAGRLRHHDGHPRGRLGIRSRGRMAVNHVVRRVVRGAGGVGGRPDAHVGTGETG